MSHGTHVNELCHPYECVMSRIWRILSRASMHHVTPINESCHTYVWVTSHEWMSHGTRMNESRHVCHWVMAHVYMRHVLALCSWHNESWHSYVEWVMVLIRIQNESYVYRMSHETNTKVGGVSHIAQVMTHLSMNTSLWCRDRALLCHERDLHNCYKSGKKQKESVIMRGSWHTCKCIIAHK